LQLVRCSWQWRFRRPSIWAGRANSDNDCASPAVERAAPHLLRSALVVTLLALLGCQPRRPDFLTRVREDCAAGDHNGRATSSRPFAIRSPRVTASSTEPRVLVAVSGPASSGAGCGGHSPQHRVGLRACNTASRRSKGQVRAQGALPGDWTVDRGLARPGTTLAVVRKRARCSRSSRRSGSRSAAQTALRYCRCYARVGDRHQQPLPHIGRPFWSVHHDLCRWRCGSHTPATPRLAPEARIVSSG
jgi:hypothetical protein